jgi:YHS domain-containing protein
MRRFKVLLICSYCLATLFATAQSSERLKNFNLENKVAIKGYDPVAYFTMGKSVKGSQQYTAEWQGVNYRFASSANKELFLKNAANYEPQYGGWCAYAMGATGEKVEVDPETFKILDGKLYLFYHSWTNNTLPKWNKDERNLKIAADKNWNTIIKK